MGYSSEVMFPKGALVQSFYQRASNKVQDEVELAKTQKNPFT